MTLLVLDASVAIQWAVPSAAGEHTPRALQLLRTYVEHKVQFKVPDVFWAEVANALCKGVRQRRWRPEDAEEGMADLKGYNFDAVPSLLLMDEAMTIALDYGIALYDCLYVALAMQAKADLITADERIANALAARFPVKWLGAF